jgi:hypothetical protein
VGGATVSSTTTGTNATIASSSIADNSWVWIETTAISGNVSEFHVSIEIS